MRELDVIDVCRQVKASYFPYIFNFSDWIHYHVCAHPHMCYDTYKCTVSARYVLTKNTCKMHINVNISKYNLSTSKLGTYTLEHRLIFLISMS